MLWGSQLKYSTLQRCLSALSILAMTGCNLTPPYQPPLTDTPYDWKNLSNEIIPSSPEQEEDIKTFKDEWKSNQPECENQISEDQARLEAIKQLNNWWEVFNDPTLNQLEEEAITYNYHLLATYEKVLEARAIARINQAALYPSVNFSPVYQRSQMLILSPLPIPTGANTQTTGGVTPLSPVSSLSRPNKGLPKNVLRFLNSEYALPFNFQYEVDLWNRLHNSYYASVYRAQAATEDYYNVLLSLTAEVAVNYFQLRDLDFQQIILIDTIRARQLAFEINRDRFNAGLLTYLDVSRAEVQVKNAESDSVNIKRSRELQENIIATLTGVPASNFSLKFNPVETPPPKVPAGLPSELLCRRPDILEAERKLAAAYAEIGVAYAGFFPSLNLNATIGLESPVTSILFNWKARMWQIAANVMQVVYDAGRTQATVDLAKARFREELNNYQETVLIAFQEVENALVNLRERAEQAKVLSQSVEFSQLTFDLSYMRYRQGLVTYLDVTDAERDLLQAKQNFAIVLGDRYVQTVNLIQAIGGGWGSCNCD